VRIAKWTAIIGGGILLLLIATVFVMTSVIDPNRYRGRVEAIVADIAGQPFVIEGNLEITWFPWLGVRMGAAHFASREGASAPRIAEWQSMAVAAKVLPLLRGQVVVDRLRLQSPHIRLRRDAQGHGNWEAALGPSSPSTSRKMGPPQIAGIEIRDGTLEYVDEMSGLEVNLSSLELDTGEWRTGQPLAVHTRFLAHSRSVAPNGVWVQVDAPELGVRLTPSPAPGAPAQSSLNVAAPKVLIRIADARIVGELAFDKTADAHVAAHGSLVAHVPSLRKLANDLALNQTMPRDPTTLGLLELTASLSYTDGAIAAKPVALKLDGVNLHGWVERSAASAWSFELRGDRIDLGRYVNVDSTKKKPFELPVDILRAINANGSVIFDEAQLADTRLSNIRLRFQTSEANQ
jgi:AsmA protein